LVEARHFGCL